MKASISKNCSILILIHRAKADSPDDNVGQLLKFAACTEPLSSLVFANLSNGFSHANSKERKRATVIMTAKNELSAAKPCYKPAGTTIIAIPKGWRKNNTTPKSAHNVICYNEKLLLDAETIQKLKSRKWLAVLNGRFHTITNNKQTIKAAEKLNADVTAVNAVNYLLPGSEKVLVTEQNRLIGFRRYYNNPVFTAPVPDSWPHQLLIKTKILDKLLIAGQMPLNFSELIARCNSNSLRLCSINTGGTVLDLETQSGLLSFLTDATDSLAASKQNNFIYQTKYPNKSQKNISNDARLFGNILLGQNVNIAKNAVIAGPAIITDNVTIDTGAVINSSIIGPSLSINGKQYIQNRLVKTEKDIKKDKNYRFDNLNGPILKKQRNYIAETFRTWPLLSYPRAVKRAADIITAIIVLLLFAPVFPVIALAIKLASKGPVFFKDTRQGLHGKTFKCLKFRTMCLGSDKLQEKLRTINEVDGPQFRIKNDPRINSVGRFLRETYIDEIPQFFNVLLGQMSTVGPRPSPESENTLCPLWRDARLSVRPGITGLWQLKRTRRPMKDFQEWIYYDIEYVRKLSIKMDLGIAIKTIGKMLKKFAEQF